MTTHICTGDIWRLLLLTTIWIITGKALLISGEEIIHEQEEQLMLTQEGECRDDDKPNGTGSSGFFSSSDNFPGMTIDDFLSQDDLEQVLKLSTAPQTYGKAVNPNVLWIVLRNIANKYPEDHALRPLTKQMERLPTLVSRTNSLKENGDLDSPLHDFAGDKTRILTMVLYLDHEPEQGGQLIFPFYGNNGKLQKTPLTERLDTCFLAGQYHESKCADIRCEDQHDRCPEWAAQKNGTECDNNPRFMKTYCRVSCKICDSPPTIRDGGDDYSYDQWIFHADTATANYYYVTPRRNRAVIFQDNGSSMWHWVNKTELLGPRRAYIFFWSSHQRGFVWRNRDE